MMDLQTIRELSNDATARARRAKRQPFISGVDADLRSLPFLGDYVPRDWKRATVDDLGEAVDRDSYDDEYALFVDISGFGSPDEPAMTFEQLQEFVDRHPGFGFGLIEQGQFQGYVGVYKLKE